MDMKLLIVTSDLAQRAALEVLLRQQPGDDGDTLLCFAATLAELRGMPPAAMPDLVLLNQDLEGAAPGVTWRALSLHYGQLPVIALVDAGRPDQARRALRRGAVAQVVVAMSSRAALLPLLHVTVAALRQQRARQARQPGLGVLDAMADAVLTTDLRGRFVYANPAATRLLGESLPRLRGQAVSALMVLRDPVTQRVLEHPVRQVLSSGSAVRLPNACLLALPGRPDLMIENASAPLRNAAGQLNGVVMAFHDVSAARRLQAQVDHLAWHDYLTGLPNRFAAQRHLEQSMAEASRRQLPLALLYLDLDRFKAVNDNYGHAAGDTLLVAVTARLRACFRSVDMISRQGGDEFVVLMAPGSTRSEAAQAAERTKLALSRPYRVDGQELQIGCSIGIALYPEHGRRGTLLLRHADTALRHAKAAGRNLWQFYDAGTHSGHGERRLLADQLRRALDGDTLALHYQPKVRLGDGSLCGCEALLRWRHADWGWVAPVRVIHSAEESGLIVPLGRWIQQHAVAQARRWECAGYQPGPLAINVSALEVRSARFASQLEREVLTAGLGPNRLQLELTESALMSDMPAATAMLRRLRGSGVSLAIDDFGTGYSSLSYLADLPVDQLKLDRSFVHGIDHASSRRQTLLQAVLSLAHNLGLPAVAEGVENAAEQAFLLAAGCAQGQGYFYSAALDEPEFSRRYLHAAATT